MGGGGEGAGGGRRGAGRRRGGGGIEKIGREGKIGISSARKARAAPRREEGDKGRDGEVRGREGRGLSSSTPPIPYVIINLGFRRRIDLRGHLYPR